VSLETEWLFCANPRKDFQLSLYQTKPSNLLLSSIGKRGSRALLLRYARACISGPFDLNSVLVAFDAFPVICSYCKRQLSQGTLSSIDHWPKLMTPQPMIGMWAELTRIYQEGGIEIGTGSLYVSYLPDHTCRQNPIFLRRRRCWSPISQW